MVSIVELSEWLWVSKRAVGLCRGEGGVEMQ